MALQVWLPLNGNLNNQGLSNVTVTNNGATVDNNGKIGKCYYFDGNDYIRISLPSKLTTIKNTTVCAWVKSTGSVIALGGISNDTNYANAMVTLYTSGWQFSGSGAYKYLSSGLTANDGIWHHVACTIDDTTITTYKDGAKVTSATLSSLGVAVTDTASANFIEIGCDHPGGDEYLTGYVNDFRIYNHALSPREVEILSRGLVCHYPLSDRSNQTPNNVATYPTFDTSSGHGGWNHWGNTGNLGHYSQNTNSQYIFRPGQAYSHCFSDESTATAPYLLYQSPSFNGGYRSLCAIIKEENGAEIKESIVYPAWNAPVSGSIPPGKWTSITPLGNGFYLGKVEGFQQDGSNNLVGLYVRAGYTVYVSEFYIENDRKVCSDFFYPSTTVYDTSGFKNNGETYAYDTTGSIECSSDTARYSLSTFINSANVTNNATGIRYIYGNCELTTPQYLTVAFWCNPIAGYGGIANNGIFALTNNDIGAGAATDYNTAPMHNRDADIDMCTSTNVHKTMAFMTTTNEWHHYAVVYDGRYGKVYKDGVHTATLDMGSNLSLASFKAIVIGYSHAGGVNRKVRAYYSDFRIYATALSAAQVAELYNTAVSVANNGTLMGYELVEG